MPGPFETVGPMSVPPSDIIPATNVPASPLEQPIVIPETVATKLKAEGFTVDRDGVMMLWQKTKAAITLAQAEEMELRKLCVVTTFTKPVEGTNKVEIGNGFVAKAVVKYNYTIKAPENSKKDVVTCVDDVIDEMSKLGNEGAFIADRVFKFDVSLVLSEYRKLVEEAPEYPEKKKLLDLVNRVLSIKEAAPTFEIIAPKGAK